MVNRCPHTVKNKTILGTSSLFSIKQCFIPWTNLLARPADGEISVLHILLSLQENTNLHEFLGSFTFIDFRDIYEESGNNQCIPSQGTSSTVAEKYNH